MPDDFYRLSAASSSSTPTPWDIDADQVHAKLIKSDNEAYWELTFTDTSTQLCLTGRGWVRGRGCSLHGYPLDEDRWLPWESPSYSSRLTVVVDDINNAVLQIQAMEEVTVQDARRSRPTLIPDAWINAARQLQPQQSQTLVRCSIVGNKGVGKSTLLRYLLHQHASTSDQPVVLLDLDAGQPECAPPGILQLVVCDFQQFPWWTPPHRHLLSGVKAVWYGHASSQQDPSSYLDAVRYLYSHYKQHHAHLSLYINHDGWAKGLGWQILQAMLQTILRPTHCCVLQGDSKSRTVEFIDELIPETSKLLTLDSYQCSTARTDSIPSAALRSLRLVSYFLNDDTIWDDLQGFDNQGIQDESFQIAKRLAAMPPYRVPLQTVRIQIGRGDDAWTPQGIYEALNASIVGLVVEEGASKNAEATDEPSNTNIGDPPPTSPSQVHPCVGLGIVRSIDRVQELLYVLTPVPQTHLRRVTTLVRGSIALPVVCLFRGPDADHWPYLEVSSTRDGKIDEDALPGSEPMQSRNTISRKTSGVSL